MRLRRNAACRYSVTVALTTVLGNPCGLAGKDIYHIIHPLRVQLATRQPYSWERRSSLAEVSHGEAGYLTKLPQDSFEKTRMFWSKGEGWQNVEINTIRSP